MGRAGHGQLIGTPITLAMLGAHTGGHLAVPLRRRFTLGTLRLELIPSGRTLGAAALHVDIGGRGVLYAGAIRSPGADVRACDAVVVTAPYGETHHRFRSLVDVNVEVVAWARANLSRRPVLVVDTALDGLELATIVSAAGLAVAGSRAIRDAALRIGALHSLPPIRAASNRESPSARAGDPSVPRTTTREPAVTIQLERSASAPSALISGRAIDGHAGFDAGFAWPNAADRKQLLAWIEATNAREVYVTGACAETIVAALGRRGRLLGPPQQMTLFPREATR